MLDLLQACLPPNALLNLRKVMSGKLRHAVYRASVRDVVTLCSIQLSGLTCLDDQGGFKSRTPLLVALVLAGNSRSTPHTHSAYNIIIRTLIGAGANVHLVDSCHGWNALDYASEMGLDQACIMLEAAGACSTRCGQQFFGVRPTAPLTRGRALALKSHDEREREPRLLCEQLK